MNFTNIRNKRNKNTFFALKDVTVYFWKTGTISEKGVDLSKKWIQEAIGMFF